MKPKIAITRTLDIRAQDIRAQDGGEMIARCAEIMRIFAIC